MPDGSRNSRSTRTLQDGPASTTTGSCRVSRWSPVHEIEGLPLGGVSFMVTLDNGKAAKPGKKSVRHSRYGTEEETLMAIDGERLRRVVVTAAVAALLALVATVVIYKLNVPTTVLVVRHAEREGPPADQVDPPLSAAGQARAQELARVVGQGAVSAIFASEFQRTQQTVQPLATARGLTVNQVPAAATAELLDQIRSNHRGGTVLVAGHSDSVDDIIDGLGGGAMGNLPASQFDNLFVVVIRRWDWTRVVHLKYEMGRQLR